MESTSFSLARFNWIDICDLLHKVWPHLCEFEKNGNAAKFLWVTKKTCKKRAKRVDLVPKMDFLDAFYPHICYLTYSIPPHIRHGLPRTVLRISRLRIPSEGMICEPCRGCLVQTFLEGSVGDIKKYSNRSNRSFVFCHSFFLSICPPSIIITGTSGG